jgi:hypothetical protein
MKIKILFLTASFILATAQLRADEGMWMPFMLKQNYKDMKKMGLKLSPKQIYDINNASLKDAIVHFGGGCTGEVISSQGLVLTNHHCGYGEIAELSTPENNYLRDGFWAKSFDEELKPKSLKVRFLVQMGDVTKRINRKLNDNMTSTERAGAMRTEMEEIKKEFSQNGRYEVQVGSFFQDNEFYFFVYEDFHDVRLVGTPTESVGKFGGDTDNWEWPRHTGDFSLFRIYADKNNQPAPYSKDNVPYRPKHHLPINIKGYQPGQFSMIMGYPGRTNRWMPAEGVRQNIDYAYPAWVEASKTAMDVLKQFMNEDEKTRLDYASKYSGIANYWKNRQGMIDALKQHKTVETKTALEKSFNVWVNKNKKNKERYGNVISDINNYFKVTNARSKHDNYLMLVLRGSNFSLVKFRLGASIEKYMANKDNEAMKAALIEEVNEFYGKLNMNLERDIFATLLKLYADRVREYPIVPAVEDIRSKSGSDFVSFINASFDRSIFKDRITLLNFINKPDEERYKTDPINELSLNLLTHYRTSDMSDPSIAEATEKYNIAFRLMVEGIRKSNKKTKFYPDANSTMRLTYGKVRALPADARNTAPANYFTILEDMVRKHKAGDSEFDLSQGVHDIYNSKNYGPYVDKNGFMFVNFLTDHDITGGNSGSPVINGKGELIGLAFDGNIEAMAGDVIFDPNLQRTINVDIRFVLLIMDKYAGARNLIDELTLVK